MEDDIPYLTEGYLGEQAKFAQYGLTTVSHHEPVIRLDTNKVDIVIGYSEKTRFTTKFKRMDPIQEMNNCVFMQNLGDSMHYSIAVSQPGFYKFEIYALPGSQAGPHFINVFNYLIHVKFVDAYVEPFPKQYPLWKQEGCFVFEPMMIQKGCNYGVKFRYHIPKAVDVQIKAGDDWHKLEKVEADTYEGYIDFSKVNLPPGSKVKLNVKFGRNNKYDILLEYTI
ncbi:uncharacterized protein LOC132749861 [Ruditapes philippinarum]|jgi:hypothetical protein|uniref:uncharacterized protein LOC132749861 n=1 Tax=Ruditapes philippinarum TaxID=129788 RepID=UPI00295B90FC|nr:uncharacterized protein LOC132749861 [Ruditapes philippinarum]